MNNINQKIPEGWSVKKLGEVFDTTTDYVAAGSFADLRDKVNYLEVPSFAQLVRTVDIKNNFNNDGFVYINQSAYDFLWRVHLDEESIILPNIGANIGEVYFLSPGKLPYSKSALGPNAILLRSSKENLFYLYCFCQTVCFRNLLDLIVGASGQPKFNKTDLKTIEILLPPLPEQEKIAGILETWDEAIEKLSSLIEQKKLLKKGLMQRLLTGKTRLKGFTQPWKEVKLGEIADFISGYSFDSEDFKEEGIVLIRISNIENDQIIIDNNTVFLDNSFIEKYQNYCLKPQDLLVAMSGATTGKMGVNKFNFPLLLNQRVGIIRAKNNNQCFINQYLIRFNNKILRMSYGGAQPNISSYDIKKIKLYIPSDTNEQQAIADVLSTADEEIDLLNKKLEALKEQKKGLMQQLLTGKTRVKVNYSCHCELSEAIQSNNGAI